MEKLVLDTGVLVEYIILRSPYRPKVTKLFDKASANELKLYVNAITLSEVLHVASRVYQVAGIDDPNKEALDLVEWINSKVRVVSIDEDLALKAGELKKQLRIALPDCYVIALAEAMGAIALFKRLEEEMKPVVSELRKLGVRFLDEMKL